MFGAIRLFLALLVVLGHLGDWSFVSTYAVFAFYIISGYLMCLVMNDRYHYSASGVRAYALNRFLRIFPPYWFACGVSVVVLGFFGDPAYGVLWYQWALPETLGEWSRNLGLFGFEPGMRNALVTPAWALRVELFFYIGIGLFLGRGRGIALVWGAGSLAYHLYLAYSGAGGGVAGEVGGEVDWGARYYPIAAASLPFSLGALIFHSRDLIARWFPRPALVLPHVLGLWVANALFAGYTRAGATAFHFYLSCALMACVVALLVNPGPVAKTLRSVDVRMGDLAYPVYLIHMQVGFVMASVFGLPQHGMPLFWAALVPVLLVAGIMLRLVDDPIERLRDRVKKPFALGGESAV